MSTEDRIAPVLPAAAEVDPARRHFLTAAAAAVAAPAAMLLAADSAVAATAQSPSAAGKAALVTGSSPGIGAAIARRLAQDGYAVTVNYLSSRERAADVVRDITAGGGKAISEQADVSDPAAVRRLFDRHQAAFGQLDLATARIPYRGHQRSHGRHRTGRRRIASWQPAGNRARWSALRTG